MTGGYLRWRRRLLCTPGLRAVVTMDAPNRLQSPDSRAHDSARQAQNETIDENSDQ